MTELPPNIQRARRADDLLLDSDHYDPEDRTGIQDLLSDLMHLARLAELDFADLLRVATDNFNAEVFDEEAGVAV